MTDLCYAWDLIAAGSAPGLLFSFLLGAALGSFSNVVIWRLPRGQSLISPSSHCPTCGAPIPPWRNIPILSYFLQQGKSACCGQPISARYPVVEILSALILASLYLLAGWNADFAFTGAWMLLLLILAAIDLEHYRLPNALVAFGALLSLLWMIVAPPQSWQMAGLGLLVAAGFALLMLLSARLFSGRWSGVGDFKVTLVLGFTFGPGRFVVLYLSAVLAALLWAALRRRAARLEGDRRIPMGPCFAAGAWIAIWLGDAAVAWYLNLVRHGF